MTPPLLSVQKLCKRFGALVVSDAISLDFPSGELHALIGPNGAGKTTFVHQLSGTLRSNSGKIIFDGQDVTALSLPERARKGLARSFQITSVLPGFSVRDNVAMAVQARSGSSFRFFADAGAETALNETAEHILERVGLGAISAWRAGGLSHGEKRLLEIAIAIGTAPRVLLLDEPLAGLGHEESQACIALLKQLKSEFTIVLVEHDMDAVFILADRVSVLVNGRVLATGSPREIQDNADVRLAYLGDEEVA